ncbi:MAG TPA: c-type cytochrome [Pseudomonadales bacterium]|nr:c-type cytochrome [Pseudomonadales bacterium]
MMFSVQAKSSWQQVVKRALGLSVGAGLLIVRLAHADQAAINHGADVFDEECAECHSLKEGKNKKGPSLFAVVGRNAGGIADYNYSDALKAGGFAWSAEKIDAYITHPKAAVPGGKMKYDGLNDEKARADLLAFLATQR